MNQTRKAELSWRQFGRKILLLSFITLCPVNASSSEPGDELAMHLFLLSHPTHMHRLMLHAHNGTQITVMSALGILVQKHSDGNKAASEKWQTLKKATAKFGSPALYAAHALDVTSEILICDSVALVIKVLHSHLKGHAPIFRIRKPTASEIESDFANARAIGVLEYRFQNTEKWFNLGLYGEVGGSQFITPSQVNKSALFSLLKDEPNFEWETVDHEKSAIVEDFNPEDVVPEEFVPEEFTPEEVPPIEDTKEKDATPLTPKTTPAETRTFTFHY